MPRMTTSIATTPATFMGHASSDTSLRLIQLLRLVPRQRKKSVREFQRELDAQGYVTTVRTVQRDLEKLAELFPIQSDGAKPAGWRWAAGAADVSLPFMEPSVALTFLILQQHARHLLPPQVLEDLQPRFEEARKALERQPDSGLRRWPQRIAVTSRSLPMIPPDIDPTIQRVVFDALARRRQLQAEYRPYASEAINRYVLHPQGLIAREGVIYLVALVDDYADPRSLALHRFIAADIVESPARDLPDFDIDRYVAEGGVSIATGGQVRLTAVFRSVRAHALTESRISHDQQVEKITLTDGDTGYRLIATVQDTLQLTWWLQSFGGELVEYTKVPVA